jgi:hypothetical protein
MAYLSKILNRFNITEFVVGDVSSPYTSIQSAINDAYTLFLSSGKSQLVYVKPGKYEEDLTFKPGVVVLGAHDPSFLNTEKLINPQDIDYNFGVFILGTHVINGADFRGDYNIKNIYFLSKGFGTTGTFSDHIIEYTESGDDGTAAKILIENCKFLIGYHPTNVSGSIFYCSPSSAAKYANAAVAFNECSFYCPSPASSGEYVQNYNAFHLVGKQNTVYKFNNCIFDGTNDNESPGGLYSTIRLRDLGTSHWLTSFERCKFSYFTIVAAEEGGGSAGYVDLSLIDCQIPIFYSSFLYCADKVGTVKVHNCLIDLGEGFFIDENSNAIPTDFSTIGTIFKKKAGTQTEGKDVDGVGGVARSWLQDSASIIDGHPPLYAVYSDSTTQTIAATNRAYPIQFNTHESTVGNGMSPPAAGVYVDDDNQATPKRTCISFSAAGVYNIQFSAQLDRTGNGTDTAHFFLRKNGETHAANVARSNTTVTVSGQANAAKTIAAWNFVVTADEGDYYQLVWSGTSTELRLLAVAAVAGTAPNYYDKVPATPSIILTVTRIR